MTPILIPHLVIIGPKSPVYWSPSSLRLFMQTQLNNDDFDSVSGESPASDGRAKPEFPSTAPNDGAGWDLQPIGLTCDFIIKIDEAKKDDCDKHFKIRMSIKVTHVILWMIILFINGL